MRQHNKKNILANRRVAIRLKIIFIRTFLPCRHHDVSPAYQTKKENITKRRRKFGAHRFILYCLICRSIWVSPQYFVLCRIGVRKSGFYFHMVPHYSTFHMPFACFLHFCTQWRSLAQYSHYYNLNFLENCPAHLTTDLTPIKIITSNLISPLIPYYRESSLTLLIILTYFLKIFRYTMIQC